MSRGKKIFIILSVVFVVIGGGAFWIYRGVTEAQKELNSIAEPMIRDLAASKWSEAVIDKYASPTMKKWMADNKITGGMPGLSVLGNVKEYEGVQDFNMTATFAVLGAKVKFASGEAYVHLQLCKCDGKWLMDAFNVTSPALFQNIMGNQNAK